MEATIVLVHSPLVGPFSWSLVAQELEGMGVEAVTPVLHDVDDAGRPFWRQHADAVGKQLGTTRPDLPLVLVGHSGAGPILPAIRHAMARPVAAYVFADAGVPEDGKSRLDLMATEDPGFAENLRRHLEAGGRFPEWSDDDLSGLITDARRRQRLLDEMRPRSLAFFEERIPVFAGWPDAPCGYLQFSSAYDAPAGRARELGWPSRTISAGHFHMLEDAPAVAVTLIDLIRELTPR